MIANLQERWPGVPQSSDTVLPHVVYRLTDGTATTALGLPSFVVVAAGEYAGE